MKLILPLLFFFASLHQAVEETVTVKCMIQMTEYRGEGAYMVFSIVDDQNAYTTIVYVLGSDKTWFSDMKAFWKHLRENNSYNDEDFYPLVDGISGATIGGNQRRTLQFQIPKKYIDQNRFLRIETAVEDKGYYQDDVRIPLTSVGLNQSYTGEGFVQRIQLMIKE